MRVLLSSFVILFGLFVVNSGFAAQPVTDQAKAAKANMAIKLYASPNTKSKILAQITPSERLVPIYQRGEWVKVGDPKNGQVGWVNKGEYRKVMQAYYRPNVQTVYIETKRDKNGKSFVNVIAYKNGKQLSDKEAKVAYEKFSREQQREWGAFERMHARMGTFFMREMQNVDMFGGFFPGVELRPSIIQPIIVIREPQSDKNDHRSKTKVEKTSDSNKAKGNKS